MIDIDGKDIWDAIQNDVVNDDLIDREILLHLDEIDCPYPSCGALRYGDWKYIRGPYTCDGSSKCGWNNAFMNDPENNILGCPIIDRQQDDDPIDWTVMSCIDGCLFNLDSDPCELYDVK